MNLRNLLSCRDLFLDLVRTVAGCPALAGLGVLAGLTLATSIGWLLSGIIVENEEDLLQSPNEAVTGNMVSMLELLE